MAFKGALLPQLPGHKFLAKVRPARLRLSTWQSRPWCRSLTPLLNLLHFCHACGTRFDLVFHPPLGKLSQSAGLVRGDAVFMDSTQFVANASMDALGLFDSPPMEPLQFIQRVFAENPVATESELDPPTGASRYRKEARKAKTKQPPNRKNQRKNGDIKQNHACEAPG